MSNIFEKAVKGKYRFPHKGQISVEDLYDLPLGALDTVFKALNTEVKKTDEESLLQTKSAEDDILATKIEIVKYIFNEKLEEKKNQQESAERKEKKQKIMQIIATKQDEALRNASVEDLQKMLDDLD